VSCVNNLKQVGLAAIQHENVRRYYANRTDSMNLRLGTWITAVMPYMEENALHDEWAQALGLGKGPPSAARPITSIMATPVATLYCPSRRPVAAYPTSEPILGMSLDPAGVQQQLGAHTDYAINGGSSVSPDVFEVKWPGIWERVDGPEAAPKRVRYRDVKDGLSKTYLIAEKAMSSNHYTSGRDPGDNSSIFDCARGNCVRFAKRVPVHDPADRENCWSCHSFGSAHPTSFNAVHCDGSVHSLTYEISFSTHAALASRAGSDRVELAN
jgi:hypothetical protein